MGRSCIYSWWESTTLQNCLEVSLGLHLLTINAKTEGTSKIFFCGNLWCRIKIGSISKQESLQTTVKEGEMGQNSLKLYHSSKKVSAKKTEHFESRLSIR